MKAGRPDEDARSDLPAGLPGGLVDAARELYALEPAEFVTSRNERARALRAAGERELAADVRALAKPSAVADLVNRLARERPEVLEDLTRTGAELRSAEGPEAMRAVARRRREAVRAALAVAIEVGGPLSAAVREQVETTLQAVVTDERAADAARSGLLVAAVRASGIGPVELDAVLAVPGVVGSPGSIDAGNDEDGDDEDEGRSTDGPVAPPSAADRGFTARRAEAIRERSRRVREAQSLVDDADVVAAEAAEDLRAAQRRMRQRQALHLQLRAELDDLRRRMAQLGQELEEAEDALVEAEDESLRAERALAETRATAERARAVLDELRTR